MAWKGNYSSVPVGDIRAASITYEQLVMHCFDTIPLMLSAATREEMFSPVETIIRYTNALLKPYWKDDEEYIEERNRIESDLSKLSKESFKYYEKLMEWVELMTSRFTKMDILPEEKVDFIAGVGEANEHRELFQ